MSFIICLALTIFLLWLLKSFFKPNFGAMMPYTPATYLLLFIIICSVLAVSVKTGRFTINYTAVILGALSFVIYSVLHYFICTKRDLRAEDEYKQKHQWKIENIDTDKLTELLTECQTQNIDITKRLCDCRCKFNDTHISPKCFTLDNSSKVTPENCMPFPDGMMLPECGNTHCSVFHTIVEHKSDCPWDIQDKVQNPELELEIDCLCLLSKIGSDDSLRKLVNKIREIP